jgi:hypothetical protein
MSWWAKNVRRHPCLSSENLAALALTMDDFRSHYAVYKSEERERRVAAQHGRKKAGQRFEKVVRERLRFWGNFHVEFLENERADAAWRSCPVPDQAAPRSEPVERLNELLELIEVTRPFWTGPFVRARNRQVRSDWHLSAIHLDSRIGPIWRAAGLKVSYGPNSIYAKFLAFAVERAEGRAGISAENVHAAFRRPTSKKSDNLESKDNNPRPSPLDLT